MNDEVRAMAERLAQYEAEFQGWHSPRAMPSDLHWYLASRLVEPQAIPAARNNNVSFTRSM